MRRLCIVAIAAFVSSSAFAGTTVCSSPDQEFFYSHSVPDMGIAPPDPIEAKVILRLQGADLPTDRVRFIENTRKKVYSHFNGWGGTDVYAIKAQVIDPTAEAPLFDDFVICKYVVKFVP